MHRRVYIDFQGTEQFAQPSTYRENFTKDLNSEKLSSSSTVSRRLDFEGPLKELTGNNMLLMRKR